MRGVLTKHHALETKDIHFKVHLVKSIRHLEPWTTVIFSACKLPNPASRDINEQPH